jgi:hypothetical protein
MWYVPGRYWAGSVLARGLPRYLTGKILGWFCFSQKPTKVSYREDIGLVLFQTAASRLGKMQINIHLNIDLTFSLT